MVGQAVVLGQPCAHKGRYLIGALLVEMVAAVAGVKRPIDTQPFLKIEIQVGDVCILGMCLQIVLNSVVAFCVPVLVLGVLSKSTGMSRSWQSAMIRSR